MKAKAYTNNYCEEVIREIEVDNLVKEMIGGEENV